MIIKIIEILLAGWLLATGTPEGKAYHYVKVHPPGTAATYYKTVGSATYAISDPAGVYDPGPTATGTPGSVIVAWVHRSETGKSMKPMIATMSPLTTTATITTLTLPISDTRKILDRNPGLTRQEDNFRACFALDRVEAGCWKLWHDAEGTWRWEGYTPREFPDPLKVYLPLMVR